MVVSMIEKEAAFGKQTKYHVIWVVRNMSYPMTDIINVQSTPL